MFFVLVLYIVQLIMIYFYYYDHLPSIFSWQFLTTIWFCIIIFFVHMCDRRANSVSLNLFTQTCIVYRLKQYYILCLQYEYNNIHWYLLFFCWPWSISPHYLTPKCNCFVTIQAEFAFIPQTRAQEIGYILFDINILMNLVNGKVENCCD